MKLIIAGSRTCKDPVHLIRAIAKYEIDITTITEVVSGCANGADTLGELLAGKHNIPVKLFPANWNALGKSAGFIRNKQMGDYADALLALWDGRSRGTRHMMDYMQDLNKPVYLYTF